MSFCPDGSKALHRWSEFTYSINYANTVTQELFGLKLQCLRKLVLRTFHVHNNDVIQLLVIQLLETWTMPALQIVSCSGSLLGSVLNTNPPLESIDARHITGSGAKVLRQCLHHPNARRLQQLSMSMYLNSAGALGNGSEPIALLELSCLQSLYVDVQFDSTILVNNFLKHVSMPRLAVSLSALRASHVTATAVPLYAHCRTGLGVQDSKICAYWISLFVRTSNRATQAIVGCSITF